MRVLISWGTTMTTTTASGSMLTAVVGGGRSARPAATSALAARRTCWQGTPATATSVPSSTRPWADTRVAPPRRALESDAGKGCIGAHPARVSARLRLDTTRRGRNGGGVGLAVGCGSGRGGGQLGNLPAPAGARPRHRQRRSQGCGIDSGVVDACGGGCLFVPGGEPNYIKKIEKMSLPYMAVDRLFKRNNQTKTHSRNAGDKCEEVRPVSKI